MTFETDFRYTDRETKSRYVWLKYRSILRGAILDVGADQCHLRSYLESGTCYWGIGLGGSPDQEIDLEQGRLPFPDGAYDCVLCLDVLEHLENLHHVFDELCRVSGGYLIVSLPNPHADFFAAICRGTVPADRPLKFYGLPLERPADRHRWFFSGQEGREFIHRRAVANGMQVVQMDHETVSPGGKRWRRWLWALGHPLLLGRTSPWKDLHRGTLWAVLAKDRDTRPRQGGGS